jgi:hypothetical protein
MQRQTLKSQNRILAVFALALLIVLVAACESRFANNPTPAPTDTPTPAPTATVAPTQTPAGSGTPLVSFDGTDPSIRDRLALTAKQVTDLKDASGRLALLAFEFTALERTGGIVTRFDKPVHVSIKFPGLAIVVGAQGEMTLLYLNPDTQLWEDVPSTVDVKAETVTADLSHFSTYGVGPKLKVPTVSPIQTPIAALTAVPRVTPGGAGGGLVVKYDAATALDTFSGVVYGRTYTYVNTGAVAAGAYAGAAFPPNDKNLLTAKAAGAAVAAYGTMSNGAETVMTGLGIGITNDVAADIAVGALGEVAITGFTAPKNQSEAQGLVNQLAPGLATIGWKLKSSSGGTYVFNVSAQKEIPTSHGRIKTAVGALATVTPAAGGKAIVSVLVGTGTQASLVK